MLEAGHHSGSNAWAILYIETLHSWPFEEEAYTHTE